MIQESDRVSVNKSAVVVAQHIIANAEKLGITVKTLANETKVINMTRGGFRAGKLFAEACMGGLGDVDFIGLDFGQAWLPGVSISVDRPSIACMASQYAGWQIKVGKFFAMGSGPARALSRVEKLFGELDYRDEADVAVIALEGRSLPDEEVAGYIADKCGVSPKALYILVAPTASIVGSVQIAARVVETGMHKMREMGFDTKQVLSGYGTCPIAPVADNDLKAIGRTNDCVLYGGKAFYVVKAEDGSIDELIKKMPSSASKDYGVSFYDLFQRYGDFYQIDPKLFSPAEVSINNIADGKTYHSGKINVEMLRKMLG
ncbi:MAG: methenyltetrahydromethanopterin cyclohydrolase [Chloroflexi bacterium]|nr:methenyltetrahydromethanopterin cyclohydrolase [Chloroflexota bacterium]